MKVVAFRGLGRSPMLAHPSLVWTDSMRIFLKAHNAPCYVVQNFAKMDDRAHALLRGRPALYIMTDEADFFHLEWCTRNGRIFLCPLDAVVVGDGMNHLRERFAWLWDHSVADPIAWLDAQIEMQPPETVQALPRYLRDFRKSDYREIARRRDEVVFDTYNNVLGIAEGIPPALASPFIDRTDLLHSSEELRLTPTLIFGVLEQYLIRAPHEYEAGARLILLTCLPNNRPIECTLQALRDACSGIFVLHRIFVHRDAGEGTIASVFAEAVS